MDQIIIADLLARGIIGIHDWEREQPQDILINITLFVDLREAGKTDDIERTVSYSKVARRVRMHAESARRLTVEALAEDIANLCLEEAGVHGARVRVEKPGAVPFAHSVGVEIVRGQE